MLNPFAIHMRPPAARARRPRSFRERTLRDSRGFTIVEVAMASFILAFGIAGSIVALQVGFRNIDLARGTTLASQIMQSEIERLRLMSFSDIDALPASADVDLATMFTADPSIADQFNVTRTVADHATLADVRVITVSVSWITHDGRSHTRSFTSLYARNGLYDYYYTLAKS